MRIGNLAADRFVVQVCAAVVAARAGSCWGCAAWCGRRGKNIWLVVNCYGAPPIIYCYTGVVEKTHSLTHHPESPHHPQKYSRNLEPSNPFSIALHGLPWEKLVRKKGYQHLICPKQTLCVDHSLKAAQRRC